MHRTQQTKRRSGFTLIEVLLAVGIFSVVLASIHSVFYTALKLRNRAAQNLEETFPIQQAMAVLRRDLQGTVPSGGLLAGGMRSDFDEGPSGGGGRLEFFTNTGVLREDLPWGDLQKVAYQLMPSTNVLDQGAFDLVRVVTRNLLPTLEQESFEDRLAPNIRQVEFLFFDGSAWIDTWDSNQSEAGLPKAVQVRIYPANTNRTSRVDIPPLELTVALRVQPRTSTTQGGSE